MSRSSVSLAVHTRRIADGAGVVTIERTVQCPTFGEAALDRCERCERYVLLTLDDADAPHCVICRPALPRMWQGAGLADQPVGVDAAHTRVDAVMTDDVTCVTLDVPVADIAALFHRQRISALPVVDYEHYPIGIVTEADLVRVPRSDQSAVVGEMPSHAAALMSPVFHTVPQDASLETAARRMLKARVHHLLVVDANERLVGILSALDLARWIAQLRRTKG